MTRENMTRRGRLRRSGAQALACLLCLALLPACAPPGARNWPFSSGPQTYAVALGDLDGDGDLDAFLANGENEVPFPDTVWLNEGEGRFSDSGQQIGNVESRDVLLVDLDVDGDLDIIVAFTSGLLIYRNDGTGVFRNSERGLALGQAGNYLVAPAAGDVNGDGYSDVFAGGCCGEVAMWDDNRRQVYPPAGSLWLSDGQGGFVDSGQTFDHSGTNAIALGDLDGDGYLDAFFGNAASTIDQTENFVQNQPNTVWFNDGQGRFRLSDQQLGTSEAVSVALGDLDGDGDLDAFAGNRGRDEVWLNAGGAQGGRPGTFILGGTVGGNEQTRSAALADLDGDGDPDALVVYSDSARVWLNDGLAGFTAGQELSFKGQHALALGDLDGDGHMDIFAGSVTHDILVWFNDGEGRFSRE